MKKVYAFLENSWVRLQDGLDAIPMYCYRPADLVSCDQNQKFHPSTLELIESFFVHHEIEVLNVKVTQQIT